MPRAACPLFCLRTMASLICKQIWRQAGAGTGRERARECVSCSVCHGQGTGVYRLQVQLQAEVTGSSWPHAAQRRHLRRLRHAAHLPRRSPRPPPPPGSTLRAARSPRAACGLPTRDRSCRQRGCRSRCSRSLAWRRRECQRSGLCACACSGSAGSRRPGPQCSRTGGRRSRHTCTCGVEGEEGGSGAMRRAAFITVHASVLHACAPGLPMLTAGRARGRGLCACGRTCTAGERRLGSWREAAAAAAAQRPHVNRPPRCRRSPTRPATCARTGSATLIGWGCTRAGTCCIPAAAARRGSGGGSGGSGVRYGGALPAAVPRGHDQAAARQEAGRRPHPGQSRAGRDRCRCRLCHAAHVLCQVFCDW